MAKILMRRGQDFQRLNVHLLQVDKKRRLIDQVESSAKRYWDPNLMRQFLSSTLTLLALVVLVPLIFTTPGLAQVQNVFIKSSTAERMSSSNPLNVFRQPLQLFSRQPMTGFHRDGYCRTGAADFGNHAVAGIVSDKFLDFTAEQGNDLRVAGLSEGCKWCLCTSRWLEAFQAYKDGKITKDAVPKVQLSATEESALRKVELDTLKEFAVKEESTNGVH